MRNSPKKSDSSKIQRVTFIGCKTSVTLDQMRKNMVPKRVALGSSSVKGQSLRPRVVAYFLGLSTMSSSWSAVHVQDVKRYSLDNCKEVLCEYSNFNQRIQTNVSKMTELEIIWPSFILAMEEASIVSEQKVYNPKSLMKDFIPSTNYQSKSGLKNGKTPNDNKGNAKKENTNNSDSEEKIAEKLTPECFSDWRTGGDTQRNGDSQHSQFILTAGTTA